MYYEDVEDDEIIIESENSHPYYYGNAYSNKNLVMMSHHLDVEQWSDLLDDYNRYINPEEHLLETQATVIHMLELIHDIYESGIYLNVRV